MKIIVCLLFAMLVASPAFAQFTTEQLQTALMPVMNELRGVKEELAIVKEELAIVKEELAIVKAEVREVKEEVVEVKVDVHEVKGEVRGQGHRITDLRTFWIAGIGLVVTAIAFLYRKSSRLETALALLQAENARLKSPIVTESGAPVQTRKGPPQS